MIHNSSSETEISNHVFKDNQSIDQASLDLLINGITSADELIRVGNLKEDAEL
jgi:general secretion pathway protein E